MALVGSWNYSAGAVESGGTTGGSSGGTSGGSSGGTQVDTTFSNAPQNKDQSSTSSGVASSNPKNLTSLGAITQSGGEGGSPYAATIFSPSPVVTSSVAPTTGGITGQLTQGQLNSLLNQASSNALSSITSSSSLSSIQAAANAATAAGQGFNLPAGYGFAVGGGGTVTPASSLSVAPTLNAGASTSTGTITGATKPATVDFNSLSISSMKQVDTYNYAVTLTGTATTAAGTAVPYTVNEQVNIPTTYYNQIMQGGGVASNALIMQFALGNLTTSNFQSSSGTPQTLQSSFGSYVGSAAASGGTGITLSFSSAGAVSFSSVGDPISTQQYAALKQAGVLNSDYQVGLSDTSQVTVGGTTYSGAELKNIYANAELQNAQLFYGSGAFTTTSGLEQFTNAQLAPTTSHTITSPEVIPPATSAGGWISNVLNYGVGIQNYGAATVLVPSGTTVTSTISTPSEAYIGEMLHTKPDATQTITTYIPYGSSASSTSELFFMNTIESKRSEGLLKHYYTMPLSTSLAGEELSAAQAQAAAYPTTDLSKYAMSGNLAYYYGGQKYGSLTSEAVALNAGTSSVSNLQAGDWSGSSLPSLMAYHTPTTSFTTGIKNYLATQQTIKIGGISFGNPVAIEGLIILQGTASTPFIGSTWTSIMAAQQKEIPILEQISGNKWLGTETTLLEYSPLFVAGVAYPFGVAAASPTAAVGHTAFWAAESQVAVGVGSYSVAGAVGTTLETVVGEGRLPTGTEYIQGILPAAEMGAFFNPLSITVGQMAASAISQVPIASGALQGAGTAWKGLNPVIRFVATAGISGGIGLAGTEVLTGGAATPAQLAYGFGFAATLPSAIRFGNYLWQEGATIVPTVMPKLQALKSVAFYGNPVPTGESTTIGTVRPQTYLDLLNNMGTQETIYYPQAQGAQNAGLIAEFGNNYQVSTTIGAAGGLTYTWSISPSTLDTEGAYAGAYQSIVNKMYGGSVSLGKNLPTSLVYETTPAYQYEVPFKFYSYFKPIAGSNTDVTQVITTTEGIANMGGAANQNLAESGGSMTPAEYTTTVTVQSGFRQWLSNLNIGGKLGISPASGLGQFLAFNPQEWVVAQGTTSVPTGLIAGQAATASSSAAFIGKTFPTDEFGNLQLADQSGTLYTGQQVTQTVLGKQYIGYIASGGVIQPFEAYEGVQNLANLNYVPSTEKGFTGSEVQASSITGAIHLSEASAPASVQTEIFQSLGINAELPQLAELTPVQLSHFPNAETQAAMGIGSPYTVKTLGGGGYQVVDTITGNPVSEPYGYPATKTVTAPSYQSPFSAPEKGLGGWDLFETSGGYSYVRSPEGQITPLTPAPAATPSTSVANPFSAPEKGLGGWDLFETAGGYSYVRSPEGQITPLTPAPVSTPTSTTPTMPMEKGLAGWDLMQTTSGYSYVITPEGTTIPLSSGEKWTVPTTPSTPMGKGLEGWDLSETAGGYSYVTTPEGTIIPLSEGEKWSYAPSAPSAPMHYGLEGWDLMGTSTGYSYVITPEGDIIPLNEAPATTAPAVTTTTPTIESPVPAASVSQSVAESTSSASLSGGGSSVAMISGGGTSEVAGTVTAPAASESVSSLAMKPLPSIQSPEAVAASIPVTVGSSSVQLYDPISTLTQQNIGNALITAAPATEQQTVSKLIQSAKVEQYQNYLANLYTNQLANEFGVANKNIYTTVPIEEQQQQTLTTQKSITTTSSLISTQSALTTTSTTFSLSDFLDSMTSMKPISSTEEIPALATEELLAQATEQKTIEAEQEEELTAVPTPTEVAIVPTLSPFIIPTGSGKKTKKQKKTKKPLAALGETQFYSPSLVAIAAPQFSKFFQNTYSEALLGIEVRPLKKPQKAKI